MAATTPGKLTLRWQGAAAAPGDRQAERRHEGLRRSAAPLGGRAHLLLVRTKPASRQGLRKPCRNPGYLLYPRLNPAGPQKARQGVGPDNGGLQSIVKKPSPERLATTGTRRHRPFVEGQALGGTRIGRGR